MRKYKTVKFGLKILCTETVFLLSMSNSIYLSINVRLRFHSLSAVPFELFCGKNKKNQKTA